MNFSAKMNKEELKSLALLLDVLTQLERDHPNILEDIKDELCIGNDEYTESFCDVTGYAHEHPSAYLLDD